MEDKKTGGKIRGILKQSQLFWELSDQQIDRLAALTKELSFSNGDRVYRAGDSAHYLYIVKKGKVSLEMEIRLGTRTRKQATIDVITPGQVFGWPALFPEKTAYTMSAIANEDTILIALDGDGFQSLCAQDVAMCSHVMHELVNLVSDRLSHATKTLAHVLSVTSHDLRAPLATVISSLDVVLGGFVGEVNSQQEELLAGCKQRINDLLNMIDNILDISHIEISELDFRNIRLAEVIESSLGDVQGMALQKKVALENHTAKDLPITFGHPNRLRQVLTNLLSNSVKFTPRHGTVSITSEESEDTTTISVTDTGIGIPQDELPRIFDDFYRGMTAEDASGAGIGLSVSKKIIEAHGGRIWAESPAPKTGQGTKVSFSLHKAGREGTDESKPEIKERAVIMVVDDDPQMLKVTSLLLESRGYKVLAARNGQEAMDKLAGVIPDMIVLDMLMPVMDGFEVLKQLSKRKNIQGKKISVIILSAVKEGSSRQRYELETSSPLPIDDYLEKPISPPILLQRVEKVLQSTASKK
jgi:signal transduction histidine kinase/CheY-like chemotaxis protein